MPVVERVNDPDFAPPASLARGNGRTSLSLPEHYVMFRCLKSDMGLAQSSATNPPDKGQPVQAVHVPLPSLQTKFRMQAPDEPPLPPSKGRFVLPSPEELGRAAGIEVWATSRTPEGRELAERLGAHRTFASGEKLPRRVEAVMDNVGQATWPHTLESVGRGGVVVTMGVTTGNDPSANLIRLFVEQITVCGTIMGTREEMNSLIQFVIRANIKPEIGQVLPMERAEEAFRAMHESRVHGKTVLTQ
jgi:hypothetical protein